MRQENRGIRRALSALALGGALALGACEAREEPPVGMVGDPLGETYAPELEVDLAQMQRTPSGLYYRDVQPGSGAAAQPGDQVVVHYTGWLPSGQEFDSSRQREPFTFRLGQGEVIPGWDEGVAGMQVGGQRRLVIPAELAYGAEGAGGGAIPPNATLVFDVELLEVGQR